MMKKWISILLAGMLLLSLFACAESANKKDTEKESDKMSAPTVLDTEEKKEEETKAPEENEEVVETGVKIDRVQGQFSIFRYSSDSEVAGVFRSRQELTAWIEGLKYSADVASNALAKYDDAYFEEKCLVVTYPGGQSSSSLYMVKDVLCYTEQGVNRYVITCKDISHSFASSADVVNVCIYLEIDADVDISTDNATIEHIA